MIKSFNVTTIKNIWRNPYINQKHGEFIMSLLAKLKELKEKGFITDQEISEYENVVSKVDNLSNELQNMEKYVVQSKEKVSSVDSIKEVLKKELILDDEFTIDDVVKKIKDGKSSSVDKKELENLQEIIKKNKVDFENAKKTI